MSFSLGNATLILKSKKKKEINATDIWCQLNHIAIESRFHIRNTQISGVYDRDL